MDDPVELERRLTEGEWLTPGEVAALLNTSRTTVHRLLGAGAIGQRPKVGSRHRLCDPEDVRRLLAKHRTVRRGGQADVPGEDLTWTVHVHREGGLLWAEVVELPRWSWAGGSLAELGSVLDEAMRLYAQGWFTGDSTDPTPPDRPVTG